MGRAQGVAEAGKADLVLLTDADIVHEPAHLASLVARIERYNLDLVSEMVRLACDSRAERALVPAFVYFFQLLYPFAWVNDSLQATAAAAGGTILIRRRALQRIGGIESVRGALIDDVALAAAVKKGGRIWLGHADLARSVRPYPSVADIWRMIARTAFVQLRYSLLLLLATTLGMALVWLVPPAGRPVRPRQGVLVRPGGVGDAFGIVSSDPAPVWPLAALGAVAAADRRLLHGGDDRIGREPFSRPRRGLEGTRVSGRAG